MAGKSLVVKCFSAETSDLGAAGALLPTMLMPIKAFPPDHQHPDCKGLWNGRALASITPVTEPPRPYLSGSHNLLDITLLNAEITGQRMRRQCGGSGVQRQRSRGSCEGRANP